MNLISKQQIITLHTLLQQKGLMEDKARIITEASGGRCSSSKELTFDEANKLINFLQAGVRSQESGDKRQKMFNHIIAMANEIGMVREETKVIAGVGLKKKKNYADLHGWVSKYGYLHKPMNDYNYEELPKLVTQFKGLYADRMKLKS